MSTGGFLEETGFWVCGLNKEVHTHPHGWAASNLLRSRVEQKSWVSTKLFSEWDTHLLLLSGVFASGFSTIQAWGGFTASSPGPLTFGKQMAELLSLHCYLRQFLFGKSTCISSLFLHLYWFCFPGEPCLIIKSDLLLLILEFVGHTILGMNRFQVSFLWKTLFSPLFIQRLLTFKYLEKSFHSFQSPFSSLISEVSLSVSQ